MAKEYSIFTSFKAKDGMTPTLSRITKETNNFSKGLSTLKEQSNRLKDIGNVVRGSFAFAAIEKTMQTLKNNFNSTYVEFANWDKGIRGVYTLLNKDEISEFGGTLKDMSKEGIRAGIAVEDVNSALFNAVSAMGMSEQTLDVYKKSLVLAKGGTADLSTSLSGMMAVINAWGPDVTDATTVANAFFTAQKNGVTTVQELAESIGSVAPIAKSMGLSVEETMASVAALTKGGMSTDMATTGLRATLTALAKPSKEAEETLRKFGVPVGIAEVRAKGLTFTLQKLIELQKKSPNAISKAIPNVKALTGVLAMDETKMKEVHKTLGMIQSDIKNGTGLNEAFEIMNTSDAASMARVMGEMKLAMIELGEVAAPYLLPLVQKFAEFIKWLGKLTPYLKIVFDAAVNVWHIFKNLYNGLEWFCNFVKNNFTGATLLLAGLFVFASHAVGRLQVQMALARMEGGLLAILMRTKMMTALTGFSSKVLECMGKISKAFMAGLLSPTGLAIAGIAALVGIVIILWKNWDKVTEYLKNFWNWCKEIFSNFANYFKENVVDIILSALGPIGLVLRALSDLGVIKLPSLDATVQHNANIISSAPYNQKTNNNGQINVDVKLTNGTDKNATTSTKLISGDNLKLKPA